MMGDMDDGQYQATGRLFMDVINNLRLGVNVTKSWYNAWGKLNGSQKRLVKKTGLEVVNIAILYAITFLLLGGEPPKKGDPWAYKAGKYMMLRLLGEAMAPYNPMEIMNILNSPTAAKPLLDNAMSVLNFFAWFNPDELKSGPYKGWRKWQKQIFKLGPWKNFYETFNSVEHKYRYLENQIF
jgi:hypothetical protein